MKALDTTTSSVGDMRGAAHVVQTDETIQSIGRHGGLAKERGGEKRNEDSGCTTEVISRPGSASDTASTTDQSEAERPGHTLSSRMAERPTRVSHSRAPAPSSSAPPTSSASTAASSSSSSSKPASPTTTSIDDLFSKFEQRYRDMMDKARVAFGSDRLETQINADLDNEEEVAEIRLDEDPATGTVKLCVEKAEELDADAPAFATDSGGGGDVRMQAMLPWGKCSATPVDDQDFVPDFWDDKTPPRLKHRICARNVLREARLRGVEVRRQNTVCGYGCGVFALKTFKKGDLVMHYLGRLVCKELAACPTSPAKKNATKTNKNSNASLTAFYERRVAEARASSQFPKVAFAETVRTDRGYRYMLELDRWHNLDGGTGGETPYAAWLSAYSNSCKDMAAGSENMIAVVEHEKGFCLTAVRFVASRDIGLGEELLWDYPFAKTCADHKAGESYADPVFEELQRLQGEYNGAAFRSPLR